MIAAISRFAVKNGKEAEVRRAFENRPREVETVPGFLGLEVFQDGATFILLTRWCDERSFREWHASAAHHQSHAMMPTGLKLDPSMTQLLVGARIDGATSEGPEGDLVNDLSVPLARLLREGASVQVAVVDGEGHIVRANGAFARAVGADPRGQSLDGLLTPASREALAVELAQQVSTSILLQLVPTTGDRSTLRAFVQRLSAGFMVVGEPPWDEHRALEARLVALNAELAVLSREHVRQARLLEKANRELHDSHWHLKKIAEVLPMCMSCRAVKTGEQSWEDVSTFLARSSDFLSHGYCARCAAMVEADLEGEP